MKSKISVNHIRSLVANMEDVRTLLGIHEKLTGNKPGNRSRVNVLNKSAIVLAVACWEVFIKDIAKSAFEYMINNAKSPGVFPKKVQVLASQQLYAKSDKAEIWKLAGEGWKKVLKDHAEIILSEELYFHAPKTKAVDKLFKELLGLGSISSCWHWQGTTNASMRLDELVKLRGDIAHKIKAEKAPLKSDVEDASYLIQKLAEKTSNEVALHVFSKTKRYPWKKVIYSKSKS